MKADLLKIGERLILIITVELLQIRVAITNRGDYTTTLVNIDCTFCYCETP